ncbi:MAG: hypothetical protein SOV91_00095 [Eubacteriales bacterium]|nr:hypothetical protein [Eubacteriales bacterium]
MKKALSLILALMLCLPLCSCNDTSNNNVKENEKTEATTELETTVEPETYYNIGDTISTDLFNFTLDVATLAIALENTSGENFGEPKEYNPKEDNDNPYVAPTGHTYAAFTYTVENISRSSEEFHGSSSGFVKVIYKDIEYNTTLEECAALYHQDHEYYFNGSMHTDKANTWYPFPSFNMLVGAGEKQSRKACADFAIEADSLTDAFYLRISVPSTKGAVIFTYQIPASN